jgi:hypothetical protein
VINVRKIKAQHLKKATTTNQIIERKPSPLEEINKMKLYEAK